MKKWMYSPLPLAIFATVMGCGGGSSTSSDQEALNAAPSFDTLSLDMEDSDALPPQALTKEDCHPHLFQRTREVVGFLNAHIAKVVARADAVIDLHPKLAVGTTRTWQKDVLGYSVKFELDKTGDGAYSYSTSMKAASDPETAFVMVSSGTIAKTDGTPHTGSGTVHMDFTALETLLKEMNAAQGQIDVKFAVDGKTKTLIVTTTNFKPEGDPRPPRSATYVFQRTKGVGGSFKFTEEVELFCPANPMHEIANVDTVARWSRMNGKFSVRADAKGSGGQIAAGNTWLGLTCADASMGDKELYWQMKVENAGGMVLKDQDLFVANDAADPSSTCDPIFGAVPALDTNANDFDFSSVNFMDGSVVSYPM
jgi:hypothetical protein